ncbi:helix-turn-helix transcriptional regulator [Streptomyces actinomycinicus]|uniref:Helix-turn-helix transcriptional regulator n=1 Tax=Streptomyces actinomycinicus TaxID=1695166 RepID=A0A937JPI6_9ACTN|nr:helix-turn-helix transcriptional regulator [Streptomyces actinomycinicus]MBL1086874.1 helix-turn-helix transcriptional regulator [Streptomyces actinomycinicus]
MESLTFDSDDLDVTADFLSRAYARMNISSGTPGSNHARVHRAGVASMSVDELALDFEMSYSVTPLGRICLCLMHEGTVRDHRFPGVEDAFGPGDLVQFAPPDVPFSGRISGARYNITMLDPALLAQVATGPDASRPVRLTGHRPHSAAAARHLGRTIAHLRDTVLSDPEIADQPLIASTAAQHLAASVLATFPHTARTEPTATDRNDAHPAVLRRALAYIDDHADEPVTVAEIAGAAHVTTRALQYAFRRHLSTTPLAHLRRVRLAHAHLDLVAAGPGDGNSVTAIAARWGFHHPGRFASLYREAYGRTPYDTLSAG